MLSYDEKYVDISVLLGQTLFSVADLNDIIEFVAEDGKVYRLFHNRDCCESVWIEDIAGDLQDLVGSPILEAEEAGGSYETGEWGDVTEWTFYKFGTIKGHVNIRWCGSSNGYYSTSVSFERVS